MIVRIHPSWQQVLTSEFDAPYFAELAQFIRNEYSTRRIYPPAGQIFAALDSCTFNDVKVVIIGQDPYHGPGQANGLCFSVNSGVPLPPSLLNIFKEISAETGSAIPQDGNLQRWAKQGVLLLNNTLTVVAGNAGSHRGHGWERFTDAIVRALATQRNNLVFMLWGADAARKGAHIDRTQHLVLTSAHPSPLSAYRGFLGNNHFTLANRYLTERGKKPIDW